MLGLFILGMFTKSVNSKGAGIAFVLGLGMCVISTNFIFSGHVYSRVQLNVITLLALLFPSKSAAETSLCDVMLKKPPFQSVALFQQYFID